MTEVIRYEHVDISYKGKRVVHDVSFSVEKGEILGIVGESGSGKSTLLKLLMRFWDVQKGRVRLSGTDVSRINTGNLREMESFVTQETHLFHDSIKNNLRIAKLDATDDEIVAACKKAAVHEFIMTLPQGYDTVVSEDSINISGGQKQLLTIARALLANRRLLILDEATSNVDTRTEILLQKAMDKLMRGRTCFVIAHRLSTIVDADLILVINDGQIVETGTHEGLLEKQGFYYRLYTSQYAV